MGKGGRPRTGTVERHELPDGSWHWDVRATLPDGSRSKRRCFPGLNEEKAREKAKALTELAAREGGVRVALPRRRKPKPGTAGELVADYADRWFDARAARGLAGVDSDRGRLRKWILPRFKSTPMARVTRDDLEAVVEHLDASVRAGKMSWKSAINIWGLASKMFDDACGSKDRALRVRADNPAGGVRGPDRGVRKAKAYLYPSEFLELVSCPEIPIESRRAIAIAVYLYVRAAEQRGLAWSDVDEAHGIAHVHTTTDRDGAAKSTKTGIARRVPIEPNLAPVLNAMRASTGGRGLVSELPDDRHLARSLRGMLKRAKLERADLHARDATRKNLTWHDLRATGITWLAIRGDAPLAIMQRAGHSDFRTTQRYIREAESLRAGSGEVFPPLPAELFETPSDAGPPSSSGGGVLPEQSPKRGPTIRNYGGGAGNRTALGGGAAKDSERLADVSGVATSALRAPIYANARDGQNPAGVSPSGADDDPGGLERALVLAAEARRFDVVALLAKELEARRLAGAGVVVLDAERARREGRR